MPKDREPFMLGDDKYVWGPNNAYVMERRLKQETNTAANRAIIKDRLGKKEDDGLDLITRRRLAFFNGEYPTQDLASALLMVLKRKFPDLKKKGFAKMYNGYIRELSGVEPHLEFHVQLITSLYMEAYYPDQRYRVDLAGLNLSRTQRGQSKLVNKDRGWHDFEVPMCSGPYNGLTMELKRYHDAKGTMTSLKCSRGPRKGQWMNDHFEEQHNNNVYMRHCGRASGFVIGAANCLEVIDCYFSEDFDRMNTIMIV